MKQIKTIFKWKDDSQELKDASNKYKRGKNSKYTYKDRPEGMKVVEKNHRVRDFLNKIIGK